MSKKCMCEQAKYIGYATSVHLPPAEGTFGARNMIYYCPHCMDDVRDLCRYANILAAEGTFGGARRKDDPKLKEKYKIVWNSAMKKYKKFDIYNFPVP